jgi:DNA-binding PadR family transcriptional regulator
MPTRRILPKPDPSLLILSSLAGGERHGYSLMKDVEEFAGVSMGPGTVFGCLARLEERGLVEALEPQDRRHPYRITAAGSAALEEQLRELERVTSTGSARLAGARRALSAGPAGAPA